jgi:hypothetical protein
LERFEKVNQYNYFSKYIIITVIFDQNSILRSSPKELVQ